MCFCSYSFDQDLPTDQDMPRAVHANAGVHPVATEVIDLTCDNKIKCNSNGKVQVPFLYNHIYLTGKVRISAFQ